MTECYALSSRYAQKRIKNSIKMNVISGVHPSSTYCNGGPRIHINTGYAVNNTP